MTDLVTSTIAFRRGTAAQWAVANPTPSAGEPCFETDTLKIKIGNGSTAYASLPYVNPGDPAFIDLTDVPNSYTDQGGKFVKVKADGSGLEFVGGTSSTVEWGGVTGDIEDQTDLQEALGAKVNADDLDDAISGNSDVSANTSARHSHSNKSTLDNITAAYTTAESQKLAGIAAGAEVNAVDSVNTQTGAVVLDADDIDDSNTANKFVTATDITNLGNLSGENTGDQDLSGYSQPGDNVSDFTNDAGYLVSGGNVSDLTNDAGYLVEADGGIRFFVYNNGSALAPGVLAGAEIEVLYDCTITGRSLFADQVGDLVIDIWKGNYASYPPVVGGSITASAKPTLSGERKSIDTTLTDWEVDLVAGDILWLNIDSASTVTWAILNLRVARAGTI